MQIISHQARIGNNKQRWKGFTMMELLIVLVIVGLLAALVGPVLYKRITPAKETVAITQIQNFTKALDAYFIDNETFPTTQQGLQALRSKPDGAKNWHGPYLKREIPKDPWGNAYVYKTPGRNGGYEIISYGADGREHGNGESKDINSWE